MESYSCASHHRRVMKVVTLALSRPVQPIASLKVNNKLMEANSEATQILSEKVFCPPAPDEL